MAEAVLTKKQQEAVDFEGDQLLIRGIAGSGKTTVLLNKARKLLRDHPGENVYLFTYNSTLASYAKELAKLLQTDKLQVWTFHSWAKQMIEKTGRRLWIVMGTAQDTLFQQIIEAMKKKSNHRYFVESKYVEFLIDEIHWLKGRGLRTLEDYLKAERAGRGTKVFVDQQDRRRIFELFELYQQELQRGKKIDFDDLTFELQKIYPEIPAFMQMDNVFIDEAQDLQLVQLKLLKHFTRKRIVIAADKGQKIYRTSFTWRDIGLNISGGRTKILQDSFRSTKQIIELAKNLQNHDPLCRTKDEEFIPANLPERNGPKPVLVNCIDYLKEEEYVVSTVKELISKQPQWTIGILCRTSKPLHRFQSRLELLNLPVETVTRQGGSVLTPGVKLMTFHSAKGLEFDAVVLIRLREKSVPLLEDSNETDEEELAVERRLLYVSMTRAKSVLYMTYYDKLTRFLQEVDEKLYEKKSL